MAKMDRVRDMVHEEKDDASWRDTPDETDRGRPGRTGQPGGGGLPDNPEARTPGDFGPGGSAGPTAELGLDQPGGRRSEAGRTRRPDADVTAPNLGKRPPGQDEEQMVPSPSNKEGTNVAP